MFSQMIFGPGLPTWAIFLELLICGMLVTVLGARLTRLADDISERLNLGRAWIGMLLLASITSLPEVVTGLTSVFLDQPDLAFGNIFGSCMFNVAIIVIINSMRPGGSIFRGADLSHSLSSAFGIVLMTLGLLGFAVVEKLRMSASAQTVQVFEIFFCGAIAVTYVMCMNLNYRFERRRQPDSQLELLEQPSRGGASLYIQFGVVAVVLIGLTMWLTRTGDVLQDHPISWLGGRTLGATFVGAFFLSVATSLPEIVTSITAVRLGHLDLALGNIFGSNMFNIFVIPILKVGSLVHGESLLLAGEHVNMLSHLIAGGFAILITSVAVSSLTYQSSRRFFRYGIDSVLIGALYLAGMYLLLQV